MAKVSVIVPAYNVAHWIGETIESVLAQTFRDWEMRIVDDGSTDATLLEIDKYQDERIHVMSQDNTGQDSARLVGLQAATGSHVVFLDADDLWLPHALQRLTEAVDDNPSAIVHGDWAYVDADGKNPRIQSSRFDKGPGLSTLIQYNPCHNHSVLIPRENLMGCDCMPTGNNYLCDWYRWLQLALAGHQFIHVPHVVALYRRHQTSYSYNSRRRASQRITTLDTFWNDSRVPADISYLKPASYATAYVDCACDAWRDGQESLTWAYLRDGLAHDNQLLGRVDTFYRLLHSNGYDSFDPISGQKLVERLVAAARSDPVVGKAYLSAPIAALGLASYHHEYWKEARYYLTKAVRYPDFADLGILSVLRSLLGAHLPMLVAFRRKLRGHKQARVLRADGLAQLA